MATGTIEHLMTVNFYSPLWMIQALLPHMRASANKKPKVIINISSTQGLCTSPGEIAYDASKHALEAMTSILGTETSPFGIRTMVVNLGSFHTAFATSGERAGLVAPTADSGADDDPYLQPEHPVQQRLAMAMKYAKTSTGARGDTKKGAALLFDAAMKTPGSEAYEALEKQRSLQRLPVQFGISDQGSAKCERDRITQESLDFYMMYRGQFLARSLCFVKYSYILARLVEW
ncbi:uncharacterized protein BCR38DRAFT_408899 [Pseudomassariella vexata]|uniref:Uncharacterized protein n=1 Tax=Pseudomassariella vexata TaxID=1141098 RepID=A0A1Y2E1E6_9PEZI|nr:uncharacterized protein BCR38DRAFT_408899 [Pseudomassariella vexata]ORY65164.1 hypothetical protein BCR38DRAFT_408899 [Pseudomassariella vexata]